MVGKKTEKKPTLRFIHITALDMQENKSTETIIGHKDDWTARKGER